MTGNYAKNPRCCLDNKYNYRVLCEIPAKNAALFPARISHKFRVPGGTGSKTWSEFNTDIKKLAAGFGVFGVKPGSHVSFFADNRYEWALTDFALMVLSAVSVPRGSDTSPKEQKLIYSHSDSTFLVMENIKHLNDLLMEFSLGETISIERIFIMDKSDEIPAETVKGKITWFADVLGEGENTLRQTPAFMKNTWPR